MYFLSWGSINTVCIISLLAQKHPSSLINKRHYFEQTYTYNRIFSYPIPKASASGRLHSKHHAIVEIGCNQTNNDFDNDRTRFSFLLLSASERNAVFSSFHPIFSAFLECSFREQEHLRREMEMKWKSTCCLQISSVKK